MRLHPKLRANLGSGGASAFRPDRRVAVGAGIVLLGGIAFETALAGLLLSIVSGHGYVNTARARTQVLMGATLWLVAALPCAVAVLLACRETFAGRRRGVLALLGLSLAALVAGLVMESAFVLGATGLLTAFCVARLGGWGPRPA